MSYNTTSATSTTSTTSATSTTSTTSSIKSLLNEIEAEVKSIVCYKQQQAVSVTSVTKVLNPKTKKGYVTRKTTQMLQGVEQVVDTQATHLARKAKFDELFKQLIEPKKAELINRRAEAQTRLNRKAEAQTKLNRKAEVQTQPQPQFNIEVKGEVKVENKAVKLNVNLAHIEEQLEKARTLLTSARNVHKKAAPAAIKQGGPSTGALRKAKARTRAIIQAKKMIARAIVAKYTKPNRSMSPIQSKANTSITTTSTSITSITSASITSITSASTNISSKTTINIKCSLEKDNTNRKICINLLEDIYAQAYNAAGVQYLAPEAKQFLPQMTENLLMCGLYDWAKQASVTDLFTLTQEHLKGQENGTNPFSDIPQDELDELLSANSDLTVEDFFSIYGKNIDDSCLGKKHWYNKNNEWYITIPGDVLEAKQEVGENLVKHSMKTNPTNNMNNTNPNSLFTFFEKVLFTAGMPSWSDPEIAKKRQAEREAKFEVFKKVFASKLNYPLNQTLLVQKMDKSPYATVKATGKLLEFVQLFNVKGVDSNLQGCTVKMGKLELEAATEEEVKEGVLLTDVYHLYVSVLSQATQEWSVNDKLTFVQTVFNKSATVKYRDNTVILHGIEFDLLKGNVLTKTQSKEVNPSVNVGKSEVIGTHALFLFVLTCMGKSERAINTLLNTCVNMFKRDENYGAITQKEDLAHQVYQNLCLPINVGAAYGNKFPYFSFKSTSLDETSLQQRLAKGELAIVDKYNKKWLATGIAAEAVLVGREGDIIRNLNDANKITKVYNRPASNKYLFAETEGRCNSHFAVALSNGEKAYSAGVKLRAAWTNSRFGHGSGVAVINPDFGFNYKVAKTLTSSFNILTLPAAVRAGKTYREVAEIIATHLNALILGTIGKTYAPEDDMLSLTCGGFTHVILKNEQKAVNLTVKNGKATLINDYEIDIKLSVEIIGDHEQFVKLRGIGKKATTLPYNVEGISEPWDILLNIEAIKGWPALIEMYSNTFGEDCFYNSNTGILTTPKGEVNLNDTHNAVTEWASSTQKEVIISFEMARSCYQDLLPVIQGFDDVTVVEKNDTTVIINERVQLIMGDLHFDVEVSTPKEAISITELTLEAANGVLIQDKALGEALMKDLLPKINATESLVNSFLAQNQLPAFNVMLQADREKLASLVQIKDGFINHKMLVKTLCKNFPNGMVINYRTRQGDYSFEIHPNALATFGGFTSNGSATRELAQVINFLYFITDTISSESGVDAAIVDICYKTSTTLSAWSTNLVQSSSAMKKFTRAGKLLAGKVRTTYSPLCNNVDGLPVIVLNPNCPIANNLGLDLSITFGQFVAITRTPMPFMTACFVRLDETCPIGHALISPKVWHAANEGDSDGDGISLLNLTKYSFTLERALKMNESLMGPKGYDFIYGENLPIYDFSSYKDKWSDKKSLTVWEKPIVNSMSVEEYGEGAILVSRHYKYNVGISYALCSQLVFAASNAIYTNIPDVEKETLVKACVIAWRGIYEGLGLSGYTPEASQFFNLLFYTAYSPINGVIKQVGKDLTFGFVPNKEGQASTELNGFLEIQKYFPNASIEVIQRLVKTRAITLTYGKIEKQGSSSISAKSPMYSTIPAAIVSGVLRRLGQGHDPVEVSFDDYTMQMEGETGPESLFELFTQLDLSKAMANPILATIAGKGSRLHQVVCKELAIRNSEEDMM